MRARRLLFVEHVGHPSTAIGLTLAAHANNRQCFRIIRPKFRLLCRWGWTLCQWIGYLGKLASLNRPWQSKEGTYRALGMAVNEIQLYHVINI
jgi:hypothetical protein